MRALVKKEQSNTKWLRGARPQSRLKKTFLSSAEGPHTFSAWLSRLSLCDDSQHILLGAGVKSNMPPRGPAHKQEPNQKNGNEAEFTSNLSPLEFERKFGHLKGRSNHALELVCESRNRKTSTYNDNFLDSVDKPCMQQLDSANLPTHCLDSLNFRPRFGQSAFLAFNEFTRSFSPPSKEHKTHGTLVGDSQKCVGRRYARNRPPTNNAWKWEGLPETHPHGRIRMHFEAKFPMADSFELRSFHNLANLAMVLVM